MRFPSIDELVAHASAAFRRFPYTISAGLLSAFLVIAVAEGLSETFGFMTRSGDGVDLLVATTLALPLLFSLRVAQERRLLSPVAAGILRAIGVAALIAVVWLWAGWSAKSRFLHYVQLSLGFHLLAASVPFARKGELNGFWQYNRALFLRFLVTALYTVVLFGGLALALVAIDNLFGVDIDGDKYLGLWGIVAFAFQTWFFMAGVPEDLARLESVEDYPNGLRLFSQYVLVPLVSVYLLILNAYLGKVLFTTEWPSGWIGWLVSCVSVAGILSTLLTHPIRHRQEYRWIATYGRWFWLAMSPSIGMLLVAGWKRIDQYGVTEPRYFLLVLTLWLAAMTIVYGFVRSQNIKWMPTSLAVLAFLTSFGPWGAYAVARSSQLNRLESLLEQNGLVRDGRAISVEESAATERFEADGTVPAEDRRQIGAALQYLFAHHGAEPLTDLLGSEVAVTDSRRGPGPIPEWEARKRAAEVMTALDLEYVEPRPGIGPGDSYHFRFDEGEAVATRGYEYVFQTGPNGRARLGDQELTFELSSNRFEVKAGGTTVLEVPLEAATRRALARADSVGVRSGNGVPRRLLRIEAESPLLQAVFYPNWISVRRLSDNSVQVNDAKGLWLVNVNEARLRGGRRQRGDEPSGSTGQDGD